MKIKKRNINIDLIKCIAVFSVISVHFFLNNGFYDSTILGKNMYIMTMFRTLFMICVPLFIITTGYLMKNKELNRKYYFGIIRVLLIYFIATTMLILYNNIYLGGPFTIRYLIKSILEFEQGYCWYIEMYIGLFLLIPFLNLIYNNLKTKKEKNALIVTMLLLTSFQGILNIHHYLIPDWWLGIYPLTYYFIGCYIKEYNPKINKIYNIILLIIVLIISAIININLSKGSTFSWGIHNDWGSILNVASSVLVFVFIHNLNLSNLNIKLKRIIIKISELSLGVYLSSAIIDNFLYHNYFKNINFMNMIGYIKIVPLVFILSISLSMIINFFYKMINKYIVKNIIEKNLNRI